MSIFLDKKSKFWFWEIMWDNSPVTYLSYENSWKAIFTVSLSVFCHFWAIWQYSIDITYIFYCYKYYFSIFRVTNFWWDTKNMHFSWFFSILTVHSTPKKYFHHIMYMAFFSCVFQFQNVILFLKIGLKLVELWFFSRFDRNLQPRA